MIIMDYIFDIFLLLVLVLVTVISTKRGFVRSIWAAVTLIGSFAVSYAFGPALGEYFCLDFILKSITEYTYNIINNLVAATEGNYNISELFTALPEEFVLLAESCGADLNSLQAQFASAIAIPQEQVYDLANSIALPVSRTVSHAVGIIALFFASVIVLSIIGLIVKIITKISVIKTIDAILGCLLGLIKGIVIICMLCVVASIFVECQFMSGDIGAYFNSLTEHSYIFRLFCSFSPIDFINIG